MNNKWNILAVLFILLLFSCSPAKNLERNDRSKVRRMLNEKIEKDKFVNYSAERMRIQLYGNQNINAFGKLYIKRDEFIFLSVQFLGIEMIRLLITNDSMKYINRVERNYLFIDLKEVQNLYSKRIDYNLIENLTVKGLLLPGEIKAKRLRYFFTSDSIDYLFKPSLGNDHNLKMAYNKYLELKNFEYINNSSSIFLNSVLEYDEKDGIQKITSQGSFKNKRIKIIIIPGKIDNNIIEKPVMHINERYSELNF